MKVSQLVLGAAIVTGLAACGREQAQPMGDSAVGAATRTSVLQNAYAEVFTITMEPGQSAEPHDGPARVIYSLSDYTIRYTEDTASRETTQKTGDVHAHPAGRHAMTNIGTTQARLLVVARSDSALPGGAPQVPEPEGTPLLDDDRFRVGVVTLPAGGVLPEHAGLPRVVYSLSDYALRYEVAGADPVERSFTSGEAHWHDADRHKMTNTGTTDARLLVVQFKR